MAKKTQKTVEAVYEEEKINKTPKEKKAKEKEETIVEKEEKMEYETPVRGGMSEMTRGLIIGVVLTALIAVIIILLILARYDSGPKQEKALYDTFQDYFEKKENTLIVFAQTTCGWCQLEHPIIERIAEMYDLDYLFLNIDELETVEQQNSVVASLGVSGGTPDSVIVKNGKVVTHNEGFLEGKDYVSFLVNAGVLPQGSTYKDEDKLVEITFSKMKEIMNSKEKAVVLFDYYAQLGDTALAERKALNDLADKLKVKVYHFSPTGFATKDEDAEFRQKLGEWGYSTEEYDEDKTSVSIPLLMIVDNGKIVWHQYGNMTASQIEEELKSAGLMK